MRPEEASQPGRAGKPERVSQSESTIQPWWESRIARIASRPKISATA